LKWIDVSSLATIVVHEVLLELEWDFTRKAAKNKHPFDSTVAWLLFMRQARSRKQILCVQEGGV
jgi:hypothetical protein